MLYSPRASEQRPDRARGPATATVAEHVADEDRVTEPRESAPRRGASARQNTLDRSSLMQRHVAARARRDGAPLGSEQFSAAAEEIARIEIAIAQLEEPPAGRPPA